MEKAPTRFKRVAETFRFYKSNSGSEHSSKGDSTFSSPDLYDLVNSFLQVEGECNDHETEASIHDQENEVVKADCEIDNASCDSMTKDMLTSLLAYDNVEFKIHHEVEKACTALGDSGSPDFKRRLMSRLRESGFDAGLCKSKWEKRGQILSGDYEYIDINVDENRYIVEVFLAGEFELARPTRQYTSLLELLPSIFVGKVEKLKQIVRLMCRSVKKSMKSAEMPVPPWRRHRYMQAKWFGSYKRRINESTGVIKNGAENCDKKYTVKRRFVGFPAADSNCLNYSRQDFGGENVVGLGLKVGNLAAML